VGVVVAGGTRPLMEEFGLFLAVVAWGVLCWLGLAFVTVPLTFMALAAGLIYGATLTIIGYLRIYRGTEDTRVLSRPDAETPRRPRAPYPRWDDAWPSYLSWQVERDVVAAAAWPRRRASELLAEGTELASSQVQLLVGLLPATPALFGFFAGVAAGTYGGWAVLGAAVEAVLLIPRCARLCAIWALRAGDSSVRWWRGTAMTCPRCRYVAWLPAYRCCNDECIAVHRDLRPGRLGVWLRRCQCGKPLPTTILRAARVLTPTCPNCGEPVHPGAGVTTDVRIVLSGGPAVGKTRLLVRATAEMTRPGPPSAWESADEPTATWLRAMQAPAEKRPEDTPDPAAGPRLLTFCRSTRGRQQYFHIADVDGRHFETVTDSPELWQLSTTRRHLLVLDPTVLPAVRDRISSAGSSYRGSGEPSDYAWTETGVVNAELPYRLLVAQLNRLGARTRRCSLALVLTRADCLAAHGLGPNGTSAKELREWQRTIGLHNLVAVAEHDFAKVRCFLVGEDQAGSAAPFEWLLRQYLRGAAIP
jgi:Double-GTPase 2